jgi:hypothetical protein
VPEVVWGTGQLRAAYACSHELYFAINCLWITVLHDSEGQRTRAATELCTKVGDGARG